MDLTTSQKTRYWRLLRRFVTNAAGCSGLGNKSYQHLGFQIGSARNTPYRAAAWKWVLRYATTDAKSRSYADLFDAVVNTFRIRVNFGRPVPLHILRVYIELWSAGGPNEQRTESDQFRSALVTALDRLSAQTSHATRRAAPR